MYRQLHTDTNGVMGDKFTQERVGVKGELPMPINPMPLSKIIILYEPLFSI
jgi:hypothetical protein